MNSAQLNWAIYIILQHTNEIYVFLFYLINVKAVKICASLEFLFRGRSQMTSSKSRQFLPPPLFD